MAATAGSKTYGDTDPILAYSYTAGDLKFSDTASVFTGSLTRAAGENAGSYAIGQGSLAAGGNYTIAFTGAQFTIDPATLHVVATAGSKTYGDVDPALAYSYTASDLRRSDTASVFTGGLTRAAGENAGSYAIGQGNLAAGGNYTIAFTGAQFTIDPAMLHVVATAGSKTCGDVDPVLAYSYTAGDLKLSDTASVFTGGLTRAAGENAGSYAIGQGSLAAGGNYTIAFTGAQFTIDPATLHVVATAGSKTYGDVDPALAYSYTAGDLKRSDTASVFTGGLTRAAGENAGIYAIGRGSLAAGGNYTIAFTGAQFTIDPATLHVAATAGSKTYGDTDPILAYSYTAGDLKFSDTASVFTGSLTRAAGENAGSYAIGQGSLAAGGNYTIAFTGAQFTIDPATLHVAATTGSKTYGDVDPALAYSYTAGDLKFSDTASVFTGGLTRAAGENAGSYAIGQGSLAAGGNYTIAFTGAQFTIDPAMLHVVATAGSKTYGDVDPVLAYSYTAGDLKFTDTASVFTGGLTRAAGENAGSYAINQGSLAAGGNYTIAFTGAQFTIDPATLHVAATAGSKTYGDVDPALAYSYTASDLKLSDTASVFTGGLTRAAGENAGSYAIGQGSLAAGGNYTIAFTGAQFTIDPATLHVVATAGSKTYGDVDPALAYSYTASDLKLSDTASVFTGGLTRAAGESAGSYAINQGSLAAGGNYTIAFTGAQFTIDPAVLSVALLGAVGRVYDGSDEAHLTAANYSLGGVLAGDAVALVPVLDGHYDGAGVGTGKTVTVTGLALAGAGAGNYVLASDSVSGTIGTITPATLTVTPAGQGKVYGDADPALAATVSGLIGSDTVSGLQLGRATGEDVGHYAITASGLLAPNYTVVYGTAELTITPKTLTVTADDATRAAGAADPVFTARYDGFVPGEDQRVLLGTLGFETDADAASPAGVYDLRPGGLSARNYALRFVDGLLVVTPATAVSPDLAWVETYDSRYLRRPLLRLFIDPEVSTELADRFGIIDLEVAPQLLLSNPYFQDLISGTPWARGAALAHWQQQASMP